MPNDKVDQASARMLEGGGETGALVRALDWSATPLGPIESWPLSLKTTAGIVLHSRHPMFLWWGPELIQIYNDAYRPSFGNGKHPTAIGQRGEECWQEIWPIIGPQIDDVMHLAKPSWHEDHLVPVWRNDRLEEVYWTYGYSPVFDETGAVGGTLVVCTETTSRVLAERRSHALRMLANATATATSDDEAIAAATKLLGETPNDTPFALIYRTETDRDELVLSQTVGLGDEDRAAVDAAWRATNTGPRDPAAAGIALARQALDRSIPACPWPEPSTDIFTASFGDGRSARTGGALVFGLSPRLPFDGPYRDYLLQIAQHLGLALGRIETYRAKEAAAAERDSLLSKAPVATALFRGPEHVFELANTLYCRMVNRFDLVGKTYRQAFPELVDTALPGLLDHVYQTGEPFSSGEMFVALDRRGDGTVEDGFFSFNLEALRDDRGRVYGMMAVAIEITEQVAARRSLEKSQKEHEALLVELEAANRAKDEFLAMLGHELRNPLSPIVTALDLMRRHGESQTNREQQIIERQVGHLVRLVDDLLDISKITRGKIALRKETLEIGQAVAKGVEIASDLFEQRRHRLSIDVPEGLRVDGDPVRLAQVVANLLTNAARYTEPGGTVSVRAARDGQDIVLSVKDSGIGIAPELLPRVFDLFVQGQRSTDRKEGGLGLGLALVRSLVSLHGGTATALSEGPGKGSEFQIRLPATAPGAETTGPFRAPVASTHGPSKRVLVVDDNIDSAEMLREMLLLVGHEVAIAHDGPSALAEAERFAPEVALLDIGLPVMDGYELARRLRDRPQTAHCQLIALTGYGQDRDREQSKASGFDAHLVKPVDGLRLLQIIAGGERS